MNIDLDKIIEYYHKDITERGGCGGPVLAYMIGLVLVFFLAGCCLGCCRGGEEVVKSDTVTITKVDTVWRSDTVPQVVEKKVVRYVPVPSDTVYVGDSAVISKADSLPITQNHYSGDSYEAWVSGYLPELDSIHVMEKLVTKELTITNTIEKKRSRWSVGLQGGYGYGFCHKGFEPFVGVGVSYRIW